MDLVYPDDEVFDEYAIFLPFLEFLFLREKMRYNKAHIPPTTKVALPGTPSKAEPIAVITNTTKQMKNFFMYYEYSSILKNSNGRGCQI